MKELSRQTGDGECNSVIYKIYIYIYVIQLTSIHFSDRFGLHPQFLAPQILEIFCHHDWVYVNEVTCEFHPRNRGWLPGEPIM